MGTTAEQSMDARTRTALEAIEAGEVTVYFRDAYSAAATVGEMRCAGERGAAGQLIAAGLSRVSTTRRPVVAVAPHLDAVANVLLTTKGRKALMRARTAEAEGEDVPVERELRRVLADLEVTSCGITATTDGNGGGSFSSAPPKSGDWDPPHIRFRREWEAIRGRCLWRIGLASDDDARRAVVLRARGETEALLERATRELREIQHSQAREATETEGQRTRRILERAGDPARDVAVYMRMTEPQVRRTRILHGRDPELGKVDLGRKVSADLIDPQERRLLARELADKHGLSSHQIAPMIGVSQMQAWRDLKVTAPAPPPRLVSSERQGNAVVDVWTNAHDA